MSAEIRDIDAGNEKPRSELISLAAQRAARQVVESGIQGKESAPLLRRVLLGSYKLLARTAGLDTPPPDVEIETDPWGHEVAVDNKTGEQTLLTEYLEPQHRKEIEQREQALSISESNVIGINTNRQDNSKQEGNWLTRNITRRGVVKGGLLGMAAAIGLGVLPRVQDRWEVTDVQPNKPASPPEIKAPVTSENIRQKQSVTKEDVDAFVKEENAKPYSTRAKQLAFICKSVINPQQEDFLVFVDNLRKLPDPEIENFLSYNFSGKYPRNYNSQSSLPSFGLEQDFSLSFSKELEGRADPGLRVEVAEEHILRGNKLLTLSSQKVEFRVTSAGLIAPFIDDTNAMKGAEFSAEEMVTLAKKVLIVPEQATWFRSDKLGVYFAKWGNVHAEISETGLVSVVLLVSEPKNIAPLI